MKWSRLALGLALLLIMLPSQAAAAPAERCFRETGYCIRGAIRTYWERNGGLPVFGYPISPLITETNNDGWTGPTQWFERDRLEDHANEGLGVLAGRLGVRYLELSARIWQNLPRVTPDQIDHRGNCRYFAVTGHSLCGAFLNYWERNGGLERFGYPISEPMQENLAEFSGTVQYFERRRMEMHPELAGTPYEVLLGLLGNEVRDPYGCKAVIANLQKTAQAYPADFGCAAPFPQISVPIVYQPFERGQMIWISGLNGSYGSIWVFFYDNARRSLVWQLHPDPFQAGDPVSGGENPPPGLVEPIRGFGKLWRSNPELRNTLGWATASELSDTGHQQYFKGGAWMVYRFSADRVYLAHPNGTADEVPRIR